MTLFEQLMALREKKDHLINKNANLNMDQKKQIRFFFETHPNLESKLDWSKNLRWIDFKALMDENKNSKSNTKKAVKNKLSLAFKGLIDDIQVWYEDKNIIFVSPKSYEISKFMRTVYNKTSHWCISTDNRNYWTDYVQVKQRAFCMIYLNQYNEKYMIEIQSPDDSNLWDEADHNVIDGNIEDIIQYFNKKYSKGPDSEQFDYLLEDERIRDLFSNSLDLFESVREIDEHESYADLMDRISALVDEYTKRQKSFEEAAREILDYPESALEDAEYNFVQDVRETIKNQFRKNGELTTQEMNDLIDSYLFENYSEFLSRLKDSRGRITPERERYYENSRKKAQRLVSIWKEKLEKSMGQGFLFESKILPELLRIREQEKF